MSNINENDKLNCLLAVGDDGKGKDLPSGYFLFTHPDGESGYPCESNLLNELVSMGLIESERTLRLTKEGEKFLKDRGGK